MLFKRQLTTAEIDARLVQLRTKLGETEAEAAGAREAYSEALAGDPAADHRKLRGALAEITGAAEAIHGAIAELEAERPAADRRERLAAVKALEASVAAYGAAAEAAAGKAVEAGRAFVAAVAELIALRPPAGVAPTLQPGEARPENIIADRLADSLRRGTVEPLEKALKAEGTCKRLDAIAAVRVAARQIETEGQPWAPAGVADNVHIPPEGIAERRKAALEQASARPAGMAFPTTASPGSVSITSVGV
jgi:hypothetical protein